MKKNLFVIILALLFSFSPSVFAFEDIPYGFHVIDEISYYPQAWAGNYLAGFPIEINSYGNIKGVGFAIKSQTVPRHFKFALYRNINAKEAVWQSSIIETTCNCPSDSCPSVTWCRKEFITPKRIITPGIYWLMVVVDDTTAFNVASDGPETLIWYYIPFNFETILPRTIRGITWSDTSNVNPPTKSPVIYVIVESLKVFPSDGGIKD
jgi:hypothetical protein